MSVIRSIELMQLMSPCWVKYMNYTNRVLEMRERSSDIGITSVSFACVC
jgi:hypothetical protein